MVPCWNLTDCLNISGCLKVIRLAPCETGAWLSILNRGGFFNEGSLQWNFVQINDPLRTSSQHHDQFVLENGCSFLCNKRASLYTVMHCSSHTGNMNRTVYYRCSTIHSLSGAMGLLFLSDVNDLLFDFAHAWEGVKRFLRCSIRGKGKYLDRNRDTKGTLNSTASRRWVANSWWNPCKTLQKDLNKKFCDHYFHWAPASIWLVLNFVIEAFLNFCKGYDTVRKWDRSLPDIRCNELWTLNLIHWAVHRLYCVFIISFRAVVVSPKVIFRNQCTVHETWILQHAVYHVCLGKQTHQLTRNQPLPFFSSIASLRHSLALMYQLVHACGKKGSRNYSNISEQAWTEFLFNAPFLKFFLRFTEWLFNGERLTTGPFNIQVPVKQVRAPTEMSRPRCWNECLRDNSRKSVTCGSTVKPHLFHTSLIA